MLTALFCLVSFARVTVVYLSKRLFPNVMNQWMLPGIEEDVLDQDHSSDSDSRNSRCTNKSKKRNLTDTVVINPILYDDYAEDEGQTSSQIVKLPVGRNDTIYKMDHEERGKCVIFSHDKFDLDIAPPRKGSEADVETIQRVFKKLGFTVETHRNYTRQGIKDTIAELAKDNHLNRDCICIFMLTHGTYNGLIYARDAVYPLLEIWKPFTANKCDTLAGKPKLFFYQACKGSGMEKGLRVYSTATSEPDSVVSTSYKIPTHADFLLAYSTTEGFFSWRDTDEGTWYIQCLCKVIEEHWQKIDLLKILTITARIIANDYTSVHNDPSQDNQKQMPSYTSTLTRDVIFRAKKPSKAQILLSARWMNGY